MKLFLIRHGETVDNVAGVYAGSRDSQLTNHGVQQAIRLGRYLYEHGVKPTHVFSSHLQRAYKTAELIRAEQRVESSNETFLSPGAEVVRLPVLVEQDFGSWEGKSWSQRPQWPGTGGQEQGIVEVESKESMSRRADAFLDAHLLPLFAHADAGSEPVVFIVSHGIILSVLWRRLLSRLPQNSVRLDAELLANGRPVSLEHIGGWSNTGYLELDTVRNDTPVAAGVFRPVQTEQLESSTPSSTTLAMSATSAIATISTVPQSKAETGSTILLPTMETASAATSAGVSAPGPPPASFTGWITTIRTVNGREHLKGLKRTRGGVGSAAHDEGQKKIESFFKRHKVE